MTILETAAAMALVIGLPASAQFKPALNESATIASEAKASQTRIDQLDDQTTSLIADYRANLKQLEAAQRYNESLRRNITSQERRIVTLQTDIDNVSGLQRAMQPLMEDMIARLGQLIEADLPFLKEDRTDRVARLGAAMDNPELSAAQRYRLIVEAYQIENEFGRTIGVSEGSIDDEGTLRTGQFFRVGRVALIFKTEDDSVLKIWDKDVGGWVNLNKSYLPDVRVGIRMAQEQTAPDLLPVPVKAPTSAAQ